MILPVNHIKTIKPTKATQPTKAVKRPRSPSPSPSPSPSLEIDEEERSSSVPPRKRDDKLRKIEFLEQKIDKLGMKLDHLGQLYNKSLKPYDKATRLGGELTHSLYNLFNATKRHEDDMNSLFRKMNDLKHQNDEILIKISQQQVHHIVPSITQSYYPKTLRYAK